MAVKPRYKVRCPHCFEQMNPFEVLFKCPWHTPPVLFSPLEHDGNWLHEGNYVRASCPHDTFWCSIRACPHCKKDLPHYAGHVPRRLVVALVGTRASGKTVFLMGLMQTLLQRSAERFPGLVPMFEDEASQEAFTRIYQDLIIHKELPGETPRTANYNPPPIVLRLYGAATGKGADRHLPPSLIFYDSPGDLFETFSNMEFVRYLAHSSAILLLFDVERLRPKATPDPEALAENPSRVLEVIAKNLRNELKLGASDRIRKRLAIVLTKCDAHLFKEHPELLPSHDATAEDMSPSARQAEAKRIHRGCFKLLDEWKHYKFLNLAQMTFGAVRLFTVSALGSSKAPREAPVEPLGVVNPLLWTVGVS